MPGVTPRGMNGYSDFGHGGVSERGSFPVGANGYDPYSRDDHRDDIMRRVEDEDPYRRPMRNGRPASDRVTADHWGDQNSLSDFNSSDPAFEVDHLATFAAGSRKGTMHVEDGLRKLRQMENTTGIWTMRCILMVERRFIVIQDKNSGEELERFPVHFVQEPTAIFKNDRREIYNNLVLFTIIDESNKRDSQADMHIFQSVSTPAQVIVDEIVAAKKGNPKLTGSGIAEISTQNNKFSHFSEATKTTVDDYVYSRIHAPKPVVTYTDDTYNRVSSVENGQANIATVDVHRDERLHQGVQGYKIPPPPTGPAPEPPGQASDLYDFRDMRQAVDQRQFGYGQQSVSYFGGGGGLIGGAQRSSMMAHLPYREREDIESSNNELLERDVQLLNHCFDDVEKFVARLQQAAEAYKELEKRKRDRNSKNKKKQNGDGMLGFRARPPPAQDFVDIFQKFKLSFNLLAKLKAHIHDPNAPELVHFLFTPLSLIYEASRDPVHGSTNLGEQAVAPVLTQDAKQLLLNCLTSKEIELWQALGKNWTTSKEEWKGPIPPYVPRFYDGWQPAPMVVEEPVVRPQIEPVVMPHHDQIRNRTMEAPTRPYVPERVMSFPSVDDRPHMFQHIDDFDGGHRAPSPRNAVSNAAVDRYQEYVEQHIQRNFRAHEPRRPEATISTPPVSQPRAPMDDNTAYLEELRRSGAIVYEVLHDRQGKNAKELTVHKGEYLQVLDNSRNWWKVRNYKGEAGFCPYTILKEVGAGGGDGGRGPSSSALDPMMDQGSAVGAPVMSSRREITDKGWEQNAGESPLYSPLHADEDFDTRHAFRPVEPAGYPNRGGVGLYKNAQQDQLTKELRNRMGAPRVLEANQYTPPPPPPPPPSGASSGNMSPQYLDTHSTQDEVTAWLEAKGFSAACRHALKGFSGRDIFGLHRQEMESIIGRDEAARLEGQLTLQKKMTGYKTQSAAELQAIFSKRRAKADHQGNLGQPPAFLPQTPNSREGQDSDSDEDDLHLADTGKTLRDLLIRQRQKIAGANIFDQGSG